MLNDSKISYNIECNDVSCNIVLITVVSYIVENQRYMIAYYHITLVFNIIWYNGKQ